MVEILLMLQVFLAADPEIEYVFCGVLLPALKPACSSAVISCLWLVSVYDGLQHDLARMADKADGSVVLAQLQVAFLWECDN